MFLTAFRQDKTPVICSAFALARVKISFGSALASASAKTLRLKPRTTGKVFKSFAL
jgi:hypothetical protein